MGSVGVVVWRATNHEVADAAGRDAASEERAVAVEVAPVESGLMREVRVLSGSLEASTRFDVTAKAEGLIEKLNVDLGDEVSAGEVVALIDDDEYFQAVAQQKAELAVRQAELAQAQAELRRVMSEFTRLEGLRQRGVVSDLEYDEVTAERASQEALVSLAEARVRQAQAALEIATIQLQYTTVKAEWQGEPERAVVAQRYEDAGNTVQIGDPILAFVGLDPLIAIVSVTEGDYTRLSVGQEATMTTDARPGESFPATVQRIAPIFAAASRQARIELLVSNTEHVLRPGMFVRVQVVLSEAEAETIVPVAAVVTRRDKQVVFTVNEEAHSVAAHEVELGITQDDRVQILSPPLSGRVVTLGQHLLDDGAHITIAE